jgi:hypothetical protein
MKSLRIVEGNVGFLASRHPFDRMLSLGRDVDLALGREQKRLGHDHEMPGFAETHGPARRIHQADPPEIFSGNELEVTAG